MKNSSLKNQLKYLGFVMFVQIIVLLCTQYFYSSLDFYHENIKFLFTENTAQLRGYYPKFYWLVIVVTKLVQFGLPFLPLLLIVAYFKKLKNQAYIVCNGLQKISLIKTILSVFLISLMISLIFYFSVDFQISKNISNNLFISKWFLIINLLSCFLLIGVQFNTVKQFFVNFFNEPLLPYGLAITRILFFSYCIFLFSVVFPNSIIADSTKVPLATIGWLVNITPVNPFLYKLACIVGVVCSFFIVIGFKTRFFLIVISVVVFYVDATPNFFGKLWHQQILIWITWILAVSPCFDVLSIDSKKNHVPITLSSKYGIHLKFLYIMFGILYFFPGFYKLWIAGFDWAFTESMINQVRLEWFENYNKIPALRIDKYPLLLYVGGLVVICFELFYLGLILSKRLRWIAAVGGLIMHNAIGYFMHISFFIFLQAFYFIYIPWNKIVAYFSNQTYKRDDEEVNFLKPSFLIPLLILSMNIVYGVLRIDSYPFSVYPSYSNIVPSTFQFLDYKILDKEYKEMNTWEEAKQTYFRWESFSRLEPAIVDKFRKQHVIDSNFINSQWLRWENGVPNLQNADTIEVYAVEVYLEPEKQNDTVYKEYLMTIY